MQLKNILLLVLSFSFFTISSQEMNILDYEVSKENPFGKYNPKAPKELKDYQDLIGKCNCTSENRKPDGTWTKPGRMTWEWKYIMNGNAVQDNVIREKGKHAGSIRQYNKDSLKWYVHYYTTQIASPKLRAWSGTKTKEGTIILYSDQKAPNGTPGFSRLTFYDINKKGYKWIGEWVDKTETVVFPFWKISCVREEN